MEFKENILDLESSFVNESEDYNDFLNRRRNNKKSIRTKVTTLKENGEVVSEILGTTISENELSESINSENKNNEQKSSADGESISENISNFQNTINDNDTNTNTNNENINNKDVKVNDVKSDNKEVNTENDKTILGMKPIYGYSLITIIALVGITAAVKIFKNKKPQISLT